MSFRLDEGHGRCVYQVGVEDDGCHSLLDYHAVAESARVLEHIARSLNAVVCERRMIQNEITEDGQKITDGEPVIVSEGPVLGDAMGQKKEEKEDDALRLRKNAFTRAEVTIQRVETHLLDPAPTSLSEIAEDSRSTELPTSKATRQEEKFTVGETLSARNIRVAVVGMYRYTCRTRNHHFPHFHLHRKRRCG